MQQSLLTPNINRVIKEVESKIKKSRIYGSENMPEVVGVLTGWETVSNNLECGGFAQPGLQLIGFTPSDNLVWDRSVICHEIGHAIQAEAGLLIKKEKVISQKLFEEHQANHIGKILHGLLYPGLEVNPAYFQTYTSDYDKKWLFNWYGGYYEDDIKLFE